MATDTVQLSQAAVSPSFLERIPIAFARRFTLIGIDEGDEELTVAMPSHDQLSTADNVGVRLGKSVSPVIADADEINGLIESAYGARDSGVSAAVEELEPNEAQLLLTSMATDQDLLDNASKAPVVKLVNVILLEAVKRRASDVHLQPYADRLQVRLRIDGVLYDYVRPPVQRLDEIVSRIKVLAGLNIAEKRLPQDGRTTVTVGKRIVDLRVSTLPTSHGERVVLRLLDKSARLYRLGELGMDERDLMTFRRLITRTHGMILVTGPTGSGKSTTLYAALQELDVCELNVLTVEDPIEYQLTGISQTQVNARKGLTFASGLRTVLRQDPDVIMVGEIRDEETARMAIQSALTGHLVFSTLHTNDAAGAVARLLDLKIEPYLVAGSLIGVMAQRLVRRVCPACKTERLLNDGERSELDIPSSEEPITVAHANGCAQCLQTGFREREGIFELLEVDDSVRKLIVGRAESGRIKQSAQASGMHTLRHSAVDKLLDGRTTAAEVLRVTQADEVLRE